jgi:hypothetical protein
MRLELILITRGFFAFSQASTEAGTKLLTVDADTGLLDGLRSDLRLRPIALTASESLPYWAMTWYDL